MIVSYQCHIKNVRNLKKKKLIYKILIFIISFPFLYNLSFSDINYNVRNLKIEEIS